MRIITHTLTKCPYLTSNDLKEVMMPVRWWRTRAIVFAVAAILLVVGVFAAKIMFASSSSGTQDGLTDDQKAAQAALFVDPSQVADDFCANLVQKYGYKTVAIAGTTQTTVVFDAGVTHSVGTDATSRLWSDAVNVPLVPQTLEAAQAVVCHDPAQAAMVMNRLGPIEIGGKTIAELNSNWIKAQGNLSEIKSWADSAMTTDVDTHLKDARTMALTAALLGRFADSGVQQVASTLWNVYLPNGAVVGSIPEFGLNPVQEENGYWLVFQYTSKTNNGLCYKFGLNVGRADSGVNGGDQRLAQFSCETVPAPAVTTPAGSTTLPKSTPPATPPKSTPPPKVTPPPCTTPEKPNDDKHLYKLSLDKCSWVLVGDNLTTGPQAQPVQTDLGNQAGAQVQPSAVPSTAPAPQPTQPLVVTNPPAPTKDGTNGGSTANPVPTGTPTPVDTGTHATPIPLPTSGPFGG